VTHATVLAVVAAPLRGEDGVEFLRCLAAVVASGGSVDLREVCEGLASAPPGSPMERYLDALASFGTTASLLEERDLRRRLADAGAVLRYGAPAEPSAALLLIDERSLEDPDLDDAAWRDRLVSAGQVVRT
jgi:hypothetical protein